MSLERFKYILDSIDDLTDYIYLHVKGEPLLHRELIQILDLCFDAKKYVQLVTNATLLNNYDEELYMHPAIRKMSISLHSLDQHNVDINLFFNRLIPLLEKSTYFIELRFWNKDSISKSDRCMHMINLICSYYSVDIDLLLKDDSYKLALRRYLNFDSEFKWPELTERDYGEVGTCLATKQMLAILVDGTVVPCCLDGNADINLGNIFDNKIETIISSNRYQAIHTNFLNNKISEKLCKKCQYRTRFNK